ncbi:hypothetical protein SAMN05216387_1092 [Nitrosovibrio tenuis]|uniref:Uncharacterized protein n=1 Tax=Nitrosovibrio tenuis TaxID=1233 RepID=A0A1H7PDU7_9PROT|nr:hypothetical protein SAMN05216387_1092 [Nitrosovibrio tenuis]
MKYTPRLLFPVGQLVTTPGALNHVSGAYMIHCLARHMRGDWDVLMRRTRKPTPKR